VAVSVPIADGGHTDADVQAAFAATLVDEWVRAGVSRAVVCPGSRSTPLAVALAAEPAVEVTVRLDERSAAFTALGIGLVTGRPALVVTTSGTAAAELHAAVVEADLGGVPLIACTADRPPELHDVGAPQTIDQTHLFGRSPRWFCDPGVPAEASRSTWRSLAARSVAEATSGPDGPGPVHLNLPFREPLLGDASRAGGIPPGRAHGRPWHVVVPPSGGLDASSLSSLVHTGPVLPGSLGLIMAGAGCGDPNAVRALSQALAWPLLAEPRSGARGDGPNVIAAADGILRSSEFAGAHRPAIVLHLGQPWVSKVVNQFLAECSSLGSTTMVVDPTGRWSDPGHSVDLFVRSDPTPFCAAVLDALGQLPPTGHDSGRDTWLDDWARAERQAQSAIDRLSVGLSEPTLARHLMAALPDGVTLIVSSSMPVRDLEAFGGPRRSPVRTVANRGANGIDGVVSTALGVAMAADGPTVALVGDLAFLHDVSALVRADTFSPALTVVVADNGGGGIFSFLAPASALDRSTFDTLFGTPQAHDLTTVAEGFGWPVDDVADLAGLESALGRRVGSGGLSVIRVRLPARSENVDRHAAINAAIAAAVDEASGLPQHG
jgi:2-succinyl-5-enolpyruvyl-6-hydroxy-3-cyclohexene-1-carboxylate synthase